MDLACSPFEIQNASCDCPIGKSEGCGHVIGLLFQIANFKMLHCDFVPEDVAKTSQPQTWHMPRGEKIGGKDVLDVSVHGYRRNLEEREEPPRPIKSTLYNPIRCEKPEPILLYDSLQQALPNSMMLDFLTEGVQRTELVTTKYGQFSRGSVISYQQKVTSEVLINDYSDTSFPLLPTRNDMTCNLSICLTKSQMAIMQDLQLTVEQVTDFEMQTRVQSSSSLWHKLRHGRITASNVGSIVKRQKDDVTKFLTQLKSTKKVQTQAMKKGLAREPLAASKYSDKCGDNVNIYPCGIVICQQNPWLAASPDRKVYNPARLTPYGLLEIKCPESESINAVECLRKDDAGFLYLNRRHNYYYQVMTQLAVTGLPWCDFFVWCEKDGSSHLETLHYDADEWQEMKDKLDVFFFKHYMC